MDGPFALKLPAAFTHFDKVLRVFVHAAQDVHVSTKIRREGIWERHETQLLLALLAPGHVFVDVGANLGYYSVIAAAQVGPKGMVFAFEPEAANSELLQRNCALNHCELSAPVQSFSLALSNSSGQQTLYLNADNLGDHQLFSSAEQRASRGSQTIESRRGDEVLLAHTARIDILKIDTQGAEYHVLAGLSAILQASVPEVKIIVEFCPYGLRHAGFSGVELLDLLAALELPFYIIDHLQGGLQPTTVKDLARWVADVDADPDNEGFMNLFLGAVDATALNAVLRPG